MSVTARPRITRRTAHRLVLPVLALAMAACSVTQPLPEDHYYRLPQPKVGQALDQPLIRGTLGVAPLTARGLYQERAILYTDARSPLELHLYHYHFWDESPGHLIQEHMVNYLKAVRIADKVVRYEPGEDADTVVSGYIDRFERLVGGKRDRVAVAVEIQYGGTDPLSAPTWDKTYAVTLPVDHGNMEGVAMAFGRALDRICREFIGDLSRAAHKGRIMAFPPPTTRTPHAR